MGSELPLGRRISVHPSMILWLSILIYLQPRLSVAFLLAAAVHELGHVTALSLMGKPPDQLHLSFLGANMDVPALSYGQAAMAYAAGPLLNLILGLYLPVCPALGLMSLALGLFNLLPVCGLDGSGILVSLLSLHFAPETAQRTARFVSIVLCILALPFAVWAGKRYHFGLWLSALAGLLLAKSIYLVARNE